MTERKGVFYALAAAALFGASTPAAKVLLRDTSPLALSGLLYLGAAVALSAYRLSSGRVSREAGISRADLPLIAGITFFGGIMGPLLMLFGLKQLSALTGSLLLNLEGPFTALIAIVFLNEHLGFRESFATAVIMVGAMLVSLEPGYFGGSWIGVIEIVAACLCWGIDNNLTQRISLRDPVAVARIKTLAAGSLVLTASVVIEGVTLARGLGMLIATALVGAVCYGVSIVFDVQALRRLGAAREAAYFATAPFVGALLSAVAFREAPGLLETAGACLMIGGLFVMLRERHDHPHTHEVMLHDHLHVHDEHHRHPHEGQVIEPHSHSHQHDPITHEHPHVSDIHHRHRHP